MTIRLLQQSNELAVLHDGLRIPDTPAPRRASLGLPLPIGSGLSVLFDRGVHFDDEGTCYVWHADDNCYAIPLNIWSHPASPIREKILLHWPYGEQLSFWHDLATPPISVPSGTQPRHR